MTYNLQSRFSETFVRRGVLVWASTQEMFGERRWSNESTWQTFFGKTFVSTKIISNKEQFLIETFYFKQRIMSEFLSYLIL